MATQETDLISEFNVYSGLDSFDQNSLEKELDLCKYAGADVDKLRALKFNALQLAEIRKGLTDKVDISKYLDPKMPWTEMEELRLEMTQNIDMTKYREEGFDLRQISQIRQGIQNGIDVSVYAKKEYLADQMRELRLGMSKNGGVPIIFFQDPQYDNLQMREIRKGLEAGIDISSYAAVDVPYMKMRAIRHSAEDGLFFTGQEIARYNANILNQMHKAYLDNVDISRYIKERFDGEQIEQIRIGLKEGLPIDEFITGDMRGDAIKEIRIGLENGVDVGKYADGAFGWQQMYEMRMGLEHQIDITPYSKPLYRADQMREIRLGLEDGLDVSQYSTMMYTAKDMRRIRELMLSGEYQAVLPDETSEAIALDRTGGVKDGKVLLESMLENKELYLSFTQNDMLCWMKLPLRADGMEYTEDVVLTFLFKCNVRKGVNRDIIADMVKEHNHNQKYLVASGKEVVDGSDGYYEYFFDTEANTEPVILKDGTADLSNLDLIQVHVGDKLAEYHRATRGADGFNVYGEVVKAKAGKEIPILKGEGFMILSDRVTYVAKYTGALTFNDGIINIQKIMVMPEVKITDKKISYDGVVYVTGDVNSGSVIYASGDVIIGGHMESSEINSGGNVIIKGGATCPIRGSITAQGDVSAKFFEGVTINAKNISANYFINCTTNAQGLIKTYGRAGIIYGGTCQSLFGIESAVVGNKSGAKTIINLGVNGSLLGEFNSIQKTISREEEDLNTLIKEKNRLQEIGAVDRQQMQWKIKINAAIGMKESKIKELRQNKEKLEEEINKGSQAQAVVTEMVYAGTIFVIDGIVYRAESDRRTYDKLTYKADALRENIVVMEG
ncbi:MAG: FapA family protein [Butyrivibrio sp.]|nr:FapA family protein [Butyrivibrio sp.]